MSGKAGPSEGAPLEGDRSAHGNAVAEGVGTAISWLTVIPLGGARTFDRITGRRAIAALPLVGLVPGAAAVLLTFLLLAVPALADAGDPASPAGAATANPAAWSTGALVPLLVGVLIVCAGEVLTRGMHVDGLADVADALGSYRDPEGARKILADPATGPMGVAAVSLVLLGQAVAFGILAAAVYVAAAAAPGTMDAAGAGSGDMTFASAMSNLLSNILPELWAGGLAGGFLPALPAALAALAIPFVAGRAAAMTACHRSLPPLSRSGFGALAAGTQPTWSVALWWSVIGASALLVAGLAGVIAAAAAFAGAWWFARRASARLGGVNGDVLGAILHVSTLASAVILAIA